LAPLKCTIPCVATVLLFQNSKKECAIFNLTKITYSIKIDVVVYGN
jgi:hypothetical protein